MMKPRNRRNRGRAWKGLVINIEESFRDELMDEYLELKGQYADVDELKFRSLAGQVADAEATEGAKYLRYRYLAAAFTARAKLEEPGIEEKERLVWEGRLDALKNVTLAMPGKIRETARILREAEKKPGEEGNAG